MNRKIWRIDTNDVLVTFPAIVDPQTFAMPIATNISGSYRYHTTDSRGYADVPVDILFDWPFTRVLK